MQLVTGYQVARGRPWELPLRCHLPANSWDRTLITVECCVCCPSREDRGRNLKHTDWSPTVSITQYDELLRTWWLWASTCKTATLCRATESLIIIPQVSPQREHSPSLWMQMSHMRPGTIDYRLVKYIAWDLQTRILFLNSDESITRVTKQKLTFKKEQTSVMK